jgi:mono/diheme cytochrome c family protein
MQLVPSASPGLRARDAVGGIVHDESRRPVSNAVIRVQTTNVCTRTRADGKFTIGNMAPGRVVQLTAFAPGYYIAGPVSATPGDIDVTLRLVRHTTEDHPSYQWLAATGSEEGGHCQSCHSDPTVEKSLLPFDEWQRDAHGTSGVNRRFLSMYNGSDLNGQHESPRTRYGYHTDYGRIQFPPDPAQPYYGPGFKLDGFRTAGNCASCHAPAATANGAYATPIG